MMKNQKPSMGRKKLEAMGVDLPPAPLTLVGGLPKQDELKELRYKVSKGVQPESELLRKEKLSMDMWIHEQERAGMDVLVDGALYQNDMVSFAASKISGFEPGGLVRCYGNRYYRRPLITGKCQWKGPIVVDMWNAAQRLTKKPVKAILTGPYTLMDWSFNEFYSSRENLCADLTAVIKREIIDLIEAGVKIIQIDEPAFSSHPDEYPIFADALKEITSGRKAYFILHHVLGDLGPLWAKMQSLPVEQFNLDGIYPTQSILPLLKKTPTNKDVSVGIIEAHNHDIETPRQLRDRVRAALKIIPSAQTWWTPDSGLAARTPEQATLKIRALGDAIKKLRDTL